MVQLVDGVDPKAHFQRMLVAAGIADAPEDVQPLAGPLEHYSGLRPKSVTHFKSLAGVEATAELLVAERFATGVVELAEAKRQSVVGDGFLSAQGKATRIEQMIPSMAAMLEAASGPVARVVSRLETTDKALADAKQARARSRTPLDVAVLSEAQRFLRDIPADERHRILLGALREGDIAIVEAVALWPARLDSVIGKRLADGVEELSRPAIERAYGDAVAPGLATARREIAHVAGVGADLLSRATERLATTLETDRGNVAFAATQALLAKMQSMGVGGVWRKDHDRVAAHTELKKKAAALAEKAGVTLGGVR